MPERQNDRRAIVRAVCFRSSKGIAMVHQEEVEQEAKKRGEQVYPLYSDLDLLARHELHVLVDEDVTKSSFHRAQHHGLRLAAEEVIQERQLTPRRPFIESSAEAEARKVWRVQIKTRR